MKENWEQIKDDHWKMKSLLEMSCLQDPNAVN